MHDITTLLDWRKSAKTRLESHSNQPLLDADALLQHSLGYTRAQLYTADDRELTTTELATLDALLIRLESDEPLAYILGHQEFWSLSFEVTKDVLIPRPDTELLVEQVLEYVNPIEPVRILELGTGTGAIALALASERPADTIVATDFSEDALQVARRNQTRQVQAGHKVKKVRFVHSDWYAGLSEEPFHVIVSNPPYIDRKDPHVDSSVRRYEPDMALFAEHCGLSAIERIIEGAAAHLSPRGRVFIEHGWKQHDSVQACFRSCGFSQIQCHRDLAGRERVTSASL